MQSTECRVQCAGYRVAATEPAALILLALLLLAGCPGPAHLPPTPGDGGTDGAGKPGDRPRDIPCDTVGCSPEKPSASGGTTSPESISGPAPAVEFRAAWVARWDYRRAEDVRRIIGELARAGFNAVYFQVRGTADAYYRSRVAPWAAPLSGKLGRDPGWDPLQVAIDTAAAEGVELHAWVNACTAWKGSKPPGRSQPRHLLRSHPDWLVRGPDGKPRRGPGGYLFFNPALPGFQKHLEAVVAELVSFYHLDGVHLDYIRYPAADTSHDRLSARLFRRARRQQADLTLAAWQRRELGRLVARLTEIVHRARPRAEVSAAVFGIWQNRWGWKNVTAGFHDFHQDSLDWADHGAIDTLVPMLYWPCSRPPGGRADFLTLARHFAARRGRARLVAGLNVASGKAAELYRQVEISRRLGFDGVALFSYGLLREHGLLDKLPRRVFARPALARPPAPAGTEVSLEIGRERAARMAKWTCSWWR